MSPDDPRHGTRRGYYAHRKDGEAACDPCKRGAAAAEARRHMPGASKRENPIGTARRIQALVAIGWTYLDIQRETGLEDAEVRRFAIGERAYVYSSTVAKVDAAFERMCMKVPPARTTRERQARSKARRLAQRNGWAPPLAWNNIDDPTERPGIRPTASISPIRERTWDTPDHRACSRCGVVRETYQSKVNPRGDMCRDCMEVEAA